MTATTASKDVETMRRILLEAFGEGKLEVLDEVMTTDFVNHNAPPGVTPGIDGVKKIIQMERKGFPDFTYEVIREVQQDDIVVQHAKVRGTHLGEIFGVAPTGRQVEWNEMHIVKVRDGLCAEHWACNDMAALWVQIGRSPRPEVKL